MSQITSIRLEDTLAERLSTLAAALDRPKTWVIEQALTRYLDEEAWQVKAIQEAVDEVESGNAILIPHEEVMRYMEDKFPELRRR